MFNMKQSSLNSNSLYSNVFSESRGFPVIMWTGVMCITNEVQAILTFMSGRFEKELKEGSAAWVAAMKHLDRQ